MVLISVLFILLAVSTAYYQNKVQKVVNEYQQKSQSLEEIAGNMIKEKESETVQIKQTVDKDKEILESGYTELKLENQNLKEEKAELQAELNTAKSDLEQEKSNFNILTERYNQIQERLISNNEQMISMKIKIDELENSAEKECSEG